MKALRLSPTQANICALVVQSRGDKQIARELGMSEETVNAHMKIISKRLDIHDRIALAVRIFDTAARFIDPPHPPNG